jgi:hypothetical protein
MSSKNVRRIVMRVNVVCMGSIVPIPNGCFVCVNRAVNEILIDIIIFISGNTLI